MDRPKEYQEWKLEGQMWWESRRQTEELSKIASRLGWLVVQVFVVLLLSSCGPQSSEPQVVIVRQVTATPRPTRTPPPTPTPRYFGEFSEALCESAWEQLDVDRGDESSMVGLILNRNHAPDSIGYVLRECIENGWDDWRP